MDSIPQWFKGVKLNFAENILYCGDSQGKPTQSPGKEDDKIACTEVREGSFLEPIRQISWKELRERVGRLSQAMRAHGVKKGDRVALVASTSLDTLTVFLAVASLGGLFSSSSTDMGVKGILDRLTQIKPKYLFMDDWALYNGRKIDLRQKMTDIVEGMKGVTEFQGLISQVRFAQSPADVSAVLSCQSWDEFLSAAKSSELVFEQLNFSDPFLIVYSSGTTGQPKCIVHAIGGVILNGHKEGRLHRCIDHNSVQLQYTTTGWIMYMASVQALLMGARMILYDGSPFIPNVQNFVHLIGQEKVTHLGISPRYLQTLQVNNIVPKTQTDLSNLRVVTSTGMVLSDALFEWFYDVGFPSVVHLDNISGGTDLAGAFGTGNPIVPVYVGGCQSMSLGMAVSVFDQNVEGGKGIQGVAVEDGVPGELVCTESFPTMPVLFWGENGAERYFNSYFEKYDNCWTHGDFIMIHPKTKQVMFLGRADGVLNPSGVRFGSSEIYSVIDAKFSDEVSDSICVGQRRPQDSDESVMLFLLMKSGKKFNPRLVRAVKEAIRKEYGPRYVPKFVFETPEIPVS
jgi:acetoacetyl-CoA synthetase